MAILIGVRWYFTVVLIYFSLIVCGVEHLFMCFLAICMSSLGKCPFISSAYSLIGFVFFLIELHGLFVWFGNKSLFVSVFFSFLIYFNWRLITLQHCGGFCHTFTWISHGCTCVPHPEPPSHRPPHPIPQGHPSAPALSTLSHVSNMDWWSVSHMIIYMFQCYSLKSSYHHFLPQSPKDCSLHLCLFCCLAYRVIITIFLNSIYMR